MKQLKKNKRPLMLTANGADQARLDIAARADAPEGIRQGLQDAKQGKVRPARKLFKDFEAEHGIPR